MNKCRSQTVRGSDVLNETANSFLPLGPALEAGKKINLRCWICVNVKAAATQGAPSQRSSAHARRHDLHFAHRRALAGFAFDFRPLEFGLHPLAALVPMRAVGPSAEGPGAEGKRDVALPGCLHQDASNPAGGQQHQAMGRTKGGLNSKISAWGDGAGRAVWPT